VTVGTKVEKRTTVGVSYDDFGEIVYKDDEFIVGSVYMNDHFTNSFKPLYSNANYSSLLYFHLAFHSSPDPWLVLRACFSTVAYLQGINTSYV
jgi:hypothetical protein